MNYLKQLIPFLNPYHSNFPESIPSQKYGCFCILYRKLPNLGH